MNDVYLDILEGFKEIGELEGNKELVDAAQLRIDEAVAGMTELHLRKENCHDRNSRNL